MNDDPSSTPRKRPPSSNPVRLDGVDRALLRQLERDARTPNNSLAAGAGIAPSTCLGRVRALRESGVIRGTTPTSTRRRPATPCRR
ncbi:Lrp/AsnC family transcriptional regulator [Pseudonocardia sp. ICBG601]|uniref:Lrp/AsnC family transcriptional regulator n=1 Tax=Pseudonocardia sp. ICBG601 TaxID=2846759 RepID=UPI001CF626F1|nr:winged helix-turn-helix transcriptional regulator [Pseudonocardia sp. ICBG601]